MKQCDKFKKLFSAYIDNEISNTEKNELEHHLDECPSCKSTVEQLDYTRKRIVALPHVRSNQNFDIVLHAKLRRQIRREQQSRLSLPSWETSKLPLVATVAVLFLAMGIMLDRVFWAKSTSLPAISQIVADRQTYRSSQEPIVAGNNVDAFATQIDSTQNKIHVKHYVNVVEYFPNASEYNGTSSYLERRAPGTETRLQSRQQSNQALIQQVSSVQF